MQITHKTALILAIVFPTLFSGAVFIAYRIVQPEFARLDQRAFDRNETRVSAALETMRDDVASRVIDYAHWDETYAFVAGARQRAYTRDLTEGWLDDYDIDLAVFADSSGRVLFQRMRETPDRDALAYALVDHARAAHAGGDAETGVVWLEGLGFVALAASQATRSDGSGAPHGWVIMGRRLSVEDWSARAQLDLQLHRPNEAPPVAAAYAAAANEAPAQWRDKEAAYSLTALHDLNGETAALLLRRQTQDISALGASTINGALIAFGLVLALVLAALWAALRAVVIKRLQKLERHFRAQGDAPQQVRARSAPDEIGRLIEAYNGLIARTNEAIAREREALLHGEAEASANRMKSDFLANVSHELRRPLDAIIGYAELVGEELPREGHEHAHADLARITASARELLALIGEILDLSKIEAGRLPLRPEPFDLREWLDGAVAAAPDTETGRLQVFADEALGEAYSDRRRLHQCLVSVLSYALRASQQHVVLDARVAPNDMLQIDVRAAGPGLNPADVLHALDPFAADGATARNTGHLALAVTRKLIALLGGFLAVRALEGGGLVFTLTAPRVIEETAAAA